MTAHGAAVREYSGNPTLGELMVMKLSRLPTLSHGQRAMLDFAHKLTVTPAEILESDRQALRDVGFQRAWHLGYCQYCRFSTT